ncbi:MAG: hypothetical protein WA547_09135 [Thermoplasmata archaeon]
MPSPSGLSTAPSRSRARRRSGVDVYLFPAVIGGGLGDIEEVLAAGRELGRAGFRTVLYRRPGRALPRSVVGPWEWPPTERTDRIVAAAPAALTVSPAWGISAAPSRPERYGRGGPWALESHDVERAYGSASTLHVSLEEFARTLPSAEENRERFREGGVAVRTLTDRLTRSRQSGELDRFRAAFRQYRAFERPNVLHLFATFRPRRGFSREFPEAVQTGPLWPRRYPRTSGPPRSSDRREWVWYASPASAARIAPEVVRALSEAKPPVRLYVRTDRPWTFPRPRGRVEVAQGPVDPVAWARRFAGAEVRIVTGSRTLLEAVELSGPFLYFNGVLGDGARRRRHRPEKIDALLEVARAASVPRELRRDLADFARGRRVRAVVRHAVQGVDGWASFPRQFRPVGFEPPYDDAGHLVVAVARALARGPRDAREIVTAARAGSPL